MDLAELKQQQAELRSEILERLLFLYRPDLAPLRQLAPDDPGRAPLTELERGLEEKRAQLRAEEMTGILTNNSNDWVDLGTVEGTDQAFYAVREERTHTNELTGQTRTFLPGGELVLRKGNTVLYADYYGHQDLSDYLPAFVRTLNSL